MHFEFTFKKLGLWEQGLVALKTYEQPGEKWGDRRQEKQLEDC